MFFLAIAADDARAGDLDTYLDLLERLWRGPEVSDEEHIVFQEQLDGFPEMQGEEEPPGILAFAYDAVAAMYYAYAYLVSGDLSNITYCSNHMLNSAGYIDDATKGHTSRYDEEIAAQLADVDALSKDLMTIDLALIRDRSRAASRDRMESLREVFQ
ncbi:hypothetical protein [Spirillospora sp. CA-294931]|uniref:hypothetical protein n=1 Tax=Spirillospora sp. CA-294931 TaxID=3240042 RepID=UPI003D8C42B3